MLIEERKSNKMPGKTSLFVSFPYNPYYVEIMHKCEVSTFDKKTKEWEVPLTELSLLLDNFAGLETIDLQVLPDESVQEESTKNYSLMNYKTSPYKYQLDGIQYGLNHDKWLLLDAPGLGKTLQLIYLAQELRKRDNIEHCLIICGLNSLKQNWKDEIEKHSNLSCKILGERKTKNGKYVVDSVAKRLEELQNPIEEFFIITNIETLRNADIIDTLKKNKVNKIDMMVLDEAHVTKDPSSIQGKHLLKLSAKYMIAATGTLLLNSPMDCYVPMKWIGAEHCTYSNFKYYYCKFAGPYNNILIGYRHIEQLKEQLDKCSLRRTKDLLELPEKTVIVEQIELNDKQRKFYDEVKAGVTDSVDKIDLKATNVLSLVTRLRQATACPSMLTTENIPSSKIDRACDLARQIVANGDKVIIFSTYKETLDILEKELKDLPCVVCHGGIKDEEVTQRRYDFQETDKYKVMLATWQKMGTGFTLHAASYEICIDTPWTDGAFEQVQDRIHRIGSKKPVFIYNLVCKDTVDERVLKLVQTKGAISDYVVDDIKNDTIINSLREYILDLSSMNS